MTANPAGRPRDAERHDAVLAAVREVLAAEGYTAITIADVARRAGVSRQLVYRWWDTRAALVAEAVFAGAAPVTQHTWAGPLRDDLRAWLGGIVAFACRPEVRAGVLGLMAEGDRDTALPRLEGDLLVPLRTSFAALLDAARARGEAREGIDVALTTDTVRGAVTMHLIADGTDPAVLVEHLTDLLARACAVAR